MMLAGLYPNQIKDIEGRGNGSPKLASALVPAGRRDPSWDTCMPRVATTRKLGVSICAYIHDRLSAADQWSV